MQRVTSRQNPRFREAVRLAASSRDRRKAQRCVLEGEHLITVYCDRVGPPETLIVADEKLADRRITALADRVPASRVLVVPRPMFGEIAASSADVGVLAVVDTPHTTLPASADFCVLLEDVQDPGNVGTILRTAAAAGIAQVLLSKRCAFVWSPKVLRAAQGAHFLTTIVENVDLPAWVARFRAGGGRAAALVARAGVDLYAADLTRPLALAVGNEGAGLSEALASSADLRLTIPMARGTESLNAAAAAAVTLFECVRQSRRIAPNASTQDR
jgi:TrmH family RNA methyltransferase